MKLSDALCIDDLRLMAKRRLPKLMFELIESGVESETSLVRNRAAFEKHLLMPRYLIDVSEPDCTTELFGQQFAAPFGIAPTGFAGVLQRGAENMIGTAAVERNIPFILSGASVAPPERIGRLGNGHAWFHIYPAKDPAITEDQLKRAWDSGFKVLVLTVDNPVFPKRERDTRNGFGRPMHKLPWPIMLEALLHPSWLAEFFLSGGMPVMESWSRYAAEGATGQQVATFFRSQSPSVQTWKTLEAMRARWPGKFVLKGIQHPDDAVSAVNAGVDGIIVSNHGGKSFDPLPSPLASLPAVKSAVGAKVPVMLDSGIRRGSDILIAKCLGADFVFVGRATLYGVVAGKREGVLKAIDILREEIQTSLALIGRRSFADLDAAFLTNA